MNDSACAMRSLCGRLAVAVGLSAQLGRPLHVAVPVGGVTPVGQAAAVDPFLTANL